MNAEKWKSDELVKYTWQQTTLLKQFDQAYRFLIDVVNPSFMIMDTIMLRGQSMLYSIGYQRLTLEGLKEILRAYDISLLIDVRSKPYSRKHQFNRKKFEQELGNAYIWKGDILGGKFGPALEEGINFLLELDRERNQILMCLENNPRNCHRYQDVGIRSLSEVWI